MAGVTQADVQRLAEPTPKDRTKQRQGNRQHGGDCQKQYGVCQLKHKILDYIDARFVMDRLDELGPGNWQDRYEDRPNGSVRCGIGVNVDGDWVWKWDVGDESDIEAEKGAHSGAFKRAGVKWGIGRDLYGDHESPGASQAPTTARSAPPPPRAPARAPEPNGDPYADLPSEFDTQPAHLQAVNTVEPPRDVRDGHYGDACPDHSRPWRTNSKGYYCSGKLDDGSWCKWRPNQRWVAEHETVPA